jgi:hypothetical protein
MDIQESYGEFFRAGVRLEKTFTAYSAFNINIADEFALRKLHTIRTGDTVAAELFHLKVQNYRLQTKEEQWLAPEQLQDFLGTDYESLFPVVNAEPPINVNFAPSGVLEAVLAACGVESAEEKLSALQQSRQSRPLNSKAIEFIMGEDYQKTPVGQYLGSTTWFWRLEVSKGDDRVVWILARLPGSGEDLLGSGQSGAGISDAGEPVRLKLVEERFSL